MKIETTPEIEALLAAGAPVAVGVSGGKDSVACALAIHEYLQEIKHTGAKMLIWADLGAVEWKDSLLSCQRVAGHVGWEFQVTQRKAGAQIKAGKIPKEWDGHELRSLVAHKCDSSAARTVIHKERRSRRAKDFWDLVIFSGL